MSLIFFNQRNDTAGLLTFRVVLRKKICKSKTNGVDHAKEKKIK